MGRNHFDAENGQVDPSHSAPPPSPPPPPPPPHHPPAETSLVRSCASPLPPMYRYVAITLLPGPAHSLYCVVETKGRVGDVWDQMCRFLGHPDPNPFGLAIILENELLFVENDAKLAKYAPKGWRNSNRYGLDGLGKPLLWLHLRIQYYLDWHFLARDRVVREHYYQQVRLNVLRQAIGDWCWGNDARYFLLAAYALQADVGPSGSDFFDPNCYFPKKVLSRVGIQYVQENIPKIHKDSSVSTLSRGQAQLEFLHEASVPPAPHNMALYRLWAGKPPSAPPVHVGLNTNGITIFQEVDGEDKCEILAQLSWPSIVKLSFEKRKFEVRVSGSKYTYWAKSERKANLLLSHCRRTHQFSMTLQARFSHLAGECRSTVPRDKLPACDNIVKRKDVNGGAGKDSPRAENRVSMISTVSVSSNTTSGIVADSRVQSVGNSEDETDVDMMCGSMESLGLERCCVECISCQVSYSGKTSCSGWDDPSKKRQSAISVPDSGCSCPLSSNVGNYSCVDRNSIVGGATLKSDGKSWRDGSGCPSSATTTNATSTPETTTELDEDRNNHLCDCQLNGTFTCDGHDDASCSSALSRPAIMRGSVVRRPCDSLGGVIDCVLTDNDEDDDEDGDKDGESEAQKSGNKSVAASEDSSRLASNDSADEVDCKASDLSRDEYLIDQKDNGGFDGRNPIDNYGDFFDLYEFNEFLPEEEEEGPPKTQQATPIESKQVEVRAAVEARAMQVALPSASMCMPVTSGTCLPPPLPPKSGTTGRKASIDNAGSSWSLLKSLRRAAKNASTENLQEEATAEEAVFVSSKTRINVLTAHATDVSSACPSFARPTVAASTAKPAPLPTNTTWTFPRPPLPPAPSLPHLPPPPPPPPVPRMSCEDLPFVGRNNYLNVHSTSTLQADWFSTQRRNTSKKLKDTKQFAYCASTPCIPETCGVTSNQQPEMSDFHAQLCSDVDYVIYPDKDPELSRQEYMDAKSASRIALEAQQMNCACCCSSSSVYQSLSAGSPTYGSLTYETVAHHHDYRYNAPPGATASDTGYGALSGRHSVSLSSCYGVASAPNSDTYYEAIQARPRLTRILGANGHGTTPNIYYRNGKASSDTYETIRPPLQYGTACGIASLAQKAQSTDNLAGGELRQGPCPSRGPLGLSEVDMSRLEEHTKSGDLPLIAALLSSFQKSSGPSLNRTTTMSSSGSSSVENRKPSVNLSTPSLAGSTASSGTGPSGEKSKPKFALSPANRPLPPLPPPPPPPPPTQRPSGQSSRKTHSLLLPFAKYGKNSYNITPSRPKLPTTAESRNPTDSLPSRGSLPKPHHL